MTTMTYESDTYGRFDVTTDTGTTVAVHYGRDGSVTYIGQGGNNWRAGYVHQADGGSWLAVPIWGGRMQSPSLCSSREDAVALVMATADRRN